MEKLYTEKQYKEYLKLMERMANTDDILEGLDIHVEIKDWIAENQLSDIAVQQMYDRIEKEFDK